MSYKSALISSLSTKDDKLTNCLDQVKSEEYDHYSQSEKIQWNAFQNLRENPTFQKKFAVFAENALCLSNTDTPKGAILNIDGISGWHAGLPPKGKKKAQIGFWFSYEQDGFHYSIVYECDSLENPHTGWFFQWEHEDSCCGCSCDYYGCRFKYPKYLKKSEK